MNIVTVGDLIKTMDEKNPLGWKEASEQKKIKFVNYVKSLHKNCTKNICMAKGGDLHGTKQNSES